MTNSFLLLIFFVAFILFLFGSAIPVQAETCACYFGDNDCAEAGLPLFASDPVCNIACITDLGDKLTSYNYATTNSALISAECNSLHLQALERAKDPTKAVTTSKPTELITPKLNVDIPGLTLSPTLLEGGMIDVNTLGEYIAGVYKYLIGVSAVFAIVMIMIGGLQYAFGGLSASQVSSAKTRIKNAVIGLVLVLSVYVIFSVINPQLVQLDSLKISLLQGIPPEAYEDPGDVGSGAEFSGVALCKSKEDCRQWCANNPNPSSWPASNEKTIAPDLVKTIPNSPGIINAAGAKATTELTQAIQQAGQIAVQKNSNYIIKIRSGYRPLKTQIKLVCDKFGKSEAEQNKIGSIVAYPGASNHGSGVAIDIQLFEGSEELVTSSASKQAQDQYKDGANILAEIMEQAGFVRYAKEIWHFELKSKASTSCRCSGSACPFPPKC